MEVNLRRTNYKMDFTCRTEAHSQTISIEAFPPKRIPHKVNVLRNSGQGIRDDLQKMKMLEPLHILKFHDVPYDEVYKTRQRFTFGSDDPSAASEKNREGCC
jgi:hypothetical protein